MYGRARVDAQSCIDHPKAPARTDCRNLAQIFLGSFRAFLTRFKLLRKVFGTNAACASIVLDQDTGDCEDGQKGEKKVAWRQKANAASPTATVIREKGEETQTLCLSLLEGKRMVVISSQAWAEKPKPADPVTDAGDAETRPCEV